MYAIVAKLKDKRVDKTLIGMGVDLSECEIFYSPIIAYLWYLGILIATVTPIFLYFGIVILKYPYWISLYIIIVYLFLAYKNNSFAIVSNQLIVINPNFPFKKVSVYNLSTIEKIVIDNHGFLYFFFSFPFLIFAFGNYVEIYTHHQKQRFYTTYLEVDCYDENITEKNLDDFYAILKKEKIEVNFKI